MDTHTVEAHAPDPFDPTALRLTDDALGTIAVEKLLTTLPVRRPDKQVFFRVHTDPSYKLETAVLTWQEDRQVYLIQPKVRHLLGTDIEPVRLVTVVDRQGNPSLWPIKLPKDAARASSWHESAAEAAILAERHWIRLTSNMQLGAYEVERALGELSAPVWPGKPFQELLRIAFRDRNIDRDDHPVIKSLQGRI